MTSSYIEQIDTRLYEQPGDLFLASGGSAGGAPEGTGGAGTKRRAGREAEGGRIPGERRAAGMGAAAGQGRTAGTGIGPGNGRRIPWRGAAGAGLRRGRRAWRAEEGVRRREGAAGRYGGRAGTAGRYGRREQGRAAGGDAGSAGRGTRGAGERRGGEAGRGGRRAGRARGRAVRRNGRRAVGAGMGGAVGWGGVGVGAEFAPGGVQAPGGRDLDAGAEYGAGGEAGLQVGHFACAAAKGQGRHVHAGAGGGMKVYPAHAILPVRREEADLHRGFAAQAADPGPAPGGRGAEDSGGGIMDGHIITS